METEVQLKRIQLKLQQLLKQYSLLQRDNHRLKEELRSAATHIESLQDTNDNLRQQVEVLKYTGGEMSDADKKDFEKKINTYIKEIDRCIGMLSQ
jgi:hypothetical protein